jgi:uncharacterized protein YoxC
VGVGLLLTFFGLVSALYFATQGIAEGIDFDQTQSALRDLLHAASFKFYTSVAGLACSIALGLLIRWGASLVENAFDRLSEALEERLLLVTPEAIAYEDSREVKQQTQYLKLFTTDVAISVGRYVEEALNKTLPGHLASAMEPVAKKLEEVTSNLTRMNEDALKSMADGFGEKLQGAAGEQVKALATVLQDLKLSLDGISTRMNSSGEELADRIRQSSDEMRAAVSAMAGAINEIAAKVEGGAARSNEAIDRQLDATRQVMAELSEKIATSVDMTTRRLEQGSEDAAAKFTSEIADAALGLRDTSAQMAGVIERAVADIGRAAETASERVTEETAGVGKALIAGAAAAGEEANGAIKAAAERSAEALLAVADELQRSVRAMGSDLDRAAYEMREVDKSLLAYRDTIERVTGTARDTEAAMTGAARAIREASAPLTTAGQTMAASSRRIGDAIDKAVVSIQASEGHTRVLADRISTTLEQVSRTWADYEKRFAGVDKSLEDALGKIVGQVQTSMDIMHKYVLEIDGKFAETLDHLGGGIDELSEFSEGIERAATELKKSVDRLALAE